MRRAESFCVFGQILVTEVMAGAAVVAAFVAFFVFMVVVVALNVGVEYKLACCKCADRFVCTAFYAAIDFYAGFG